MQYNKIFSAFIVVSQEKQIRINKGASLGKKYFRLAFVFGCPDLPQQRLKSFLSVPASETFALNF
jgi:hypothetical protein